MVNSGRFLVNSCSTTLVAGIFTRASLGKLAGVSIRHNAASIPIQRRCVANDELVAIKSRTTSIFVLADGATVLLVPVVVAIVFRVRVEGP